MRMEKNGNKRNVLKGVLALVLVFALALTVIPAGQVQAASWKKSVTKTYTSQLKKDIIIPIKMKKAATVTITLTADSKKCDAEFIHGYGILDSEGDEIIETDYLYGPESGVGQELGTECYKATGKVKLPKGTSYLVLVGDEEDGPRAASMKVKVSCSKAYVQIGSPVAAE